MLILQNYFPGQKVTMFLESLNPTTNVRQDGYDLGDGYDGYPVINRVIFPDLTLAQNFPQHMVKLDNGLYFFQFTVPFMASSVGSYLVDGYYNQSVTGQIRPFLYQIVVNAPFGNFGTQSG
jgi:hypothetical protein